MFNLLAVLGMGSTVHAAPLGNEVLFRDYATMLVLTIALFFMAYGFRGKKGQINRIEATLLLMAYAGYMGWLYFTEVSQI